MRIRELIWDDWNEDHIAGHGVRRAEVEYVCFDRRSLGVRIRGQRYRIIGQSRAGRYLAVFLDALRDNDFYIVTARDAIDGERRRLQRAHGR